MTGRTGTRGAGSGHGWRIAVWGGAAALLLAPAVATQATDEMRWDSADFILVGSLLAATCVAWEVAIRRIGNWACAAAVTVAVGTAFLLFLVNGAVGILGDEGNPVNLIFFGVIAVAVGGAVIVRLRPEGMARALAVTAATQIVAGMIGAALVPDIRGFLVGTALFTPLWLLAAALFRKAAGERPGTSEAS